MESDRLPIRITHLALRFLCAFASGRPNARICSTVVDVR
jgi:hypothetical protein